MDIDEPPQIGAHHPLSNLSANTNTDPFSVLDSTFGRGLSDGHSDVSNRAPFVTHPRQVREIHIGVNHGNQPTSQSGLAPPIEDVTGTALAHDPHARGAVIVDGNESTTVNQNALDHSRETNNAAVSSLVRSARSSAPEFENSTDFGNDIEEEMIRAAIEASKREVEQKHPNQLDEPQSRQSNIEDPELAHAVSLSMKTAEKEKAPHVLSDVEAPKVASSEPSDFRLVNTSLENGRLEAGSSSVPSRDMEEEPLDGHRSRHASSGTFELPSDVEARSPPRIRNDSGDHPEHDTSSFPTDEWGGISSEEHDEAVMLEAAMFGGIPEDSRYHYTYAPHQFMQHESSYPRPSPRPPSPSLTAQRLIREQQDDEYLASLQADREKELRAKEEAEAALEEERRREEESSQKLQEEQELDRQLAAKEVSLPQEPSPDDENGVTLLVRMPDGSRRGRRFLKSDSLQSLFDFIDVARVVKPGTYRLVRPYPRRAFSDGENSLTLNELGLTSKQEALFLELI